MSKTKPHDAVAGCVHGSTMDTENKGLTKREWLFGRAISCADLDTPPEKAVDWALKATEIAIKRLNENTKEVEI